MLANQPVHTLSMEGVPAQGVSLGRDLKGVVFLEPDLVSTWS